MLTPHLNILPSSQRRLWDELRAIPPGFVLYGGTALALRLGHRASEDFDFFSNRAFQPDDLERLIPFLEGAPRLQSSPNTLTSLVERDGAVKVYGEAFNPLLSLKALSYFGDGDLRALPESLKSRLSGAAGRVDIKSLPRFEPLSGGLAP